MCSAGAPAPAAGPLLLCLHARADELAPLAHLGVGQAVLRVGAEAEDRLTYAEVRERRELIRTRMQAQQQRKRRRGRP